jgi:hypothetical protein
MRTSVFAFRVRALTRASQDSGSSLSPLPLSLSSGRASLSSASYQSPRSSALPAASYQHQSVSPAVSVQRSTLPSLLPTSGPHTFGLGSGFSGTSFPTDERLLSTSGQMTECEMFAVYAALFSYRSVLCHCCALIWVGQPDQTSMY